MLRIDSYTATGSCGSYARLCIQVDLEMPFIKWVRVGRINQQVLYEGISTLRFCCGRIGHKQESCCYRVKQVKKSVVEAERSPNQDEGQVDQLDSNFGPWMLVTRRRTSV